MSTSIHPSVCLRGRQRKEMLPLYVERICRLIVKVVNYRKQLAVRWLRWPLCTGVSALVLCSSFQHRGCSQRGQFQNLCRTDVKMTPPETSNLQETKSQWNSLEQLCVSPLWCEVMCDVKWTFRPGQHSANYLADCYLMKGFTLLQFKCYAFTCRLWMLQLCEFWHFIWTLFYETNIDIFKSWKIQLFITTSIVLYYNSVMLLLSVIIDSWRYLIAHLIRNTQMAITIMTKSHFSVHTICYDMVMLVL